MNKSIFRGSIWWVNLDPTIGHEQAKKRPCLIISHNIFNQGAAELVVILPITSKFKPISWLVEVKPNILKSKSYIICNQIRTISTKRLLGNCIGNVNDHTLKLVEERLKFLLEL